MVDNNKKLVLEVGKKYVCRDKKDVKYVEILATNLLLHNPSHNVCAVIHSLKGTHQITSYTESGTYHMDGIVESRMDLVAEYSEPTSDAEEKEVITNTDLTNTDLNYWYAEIAAYYAADLSSVSRSCAISKSRAWNGTEKCECGASSVRGSMNSSWCPANKKENLE